MATPAEDRVPGEKVKMTVSERSPAALGAPWSAGWPRWPAEEASPVPA